MGLRVDEIKRRGELSRGDDEDGERGIRRGQKKKESRKDEDRKQSQHEVK